LTGQFAFYGHMQLPCCGQGAGGYHFSLKGNDLHVEQGNTLISSFDLTPWIAEQNFAVTKLRERRIEIPIEDKTLILFVDEANLERKAENEYRVARLHFFLFAKTNNGAD